MAFYNSFLNFNSYTPMFNFGCFNMPSFFSGFSPFGCVNFRLNNFGYNNFGLNSYSFNNVFQMPFMQMSYPVSNNVGASVFTGFTNNSWQNLNFQTSTFDSFNRSSFSDYSWNMPVKFTPTSVPKSSSDEKVYNSDKDIYASNNADFLSGLTDEMQDKTKKLIAYANKEGYDVKIISGYRTQAEQKNLQARYQNEPGRVATNSAHCQGKAIDITVTKNGIESDEGYELLGNYAKSNLGLRWGNDFTSYRERWHFDCRSA